MREYSGKTADVIRIACSVALAAVFFCAAFFAQPARVGATDGTPGVGIGNVGGDGMAEGTRNEPASGIGDSISRGLDDVKDGAGSLFPDMIGGEGTEGPGRGPAETDPGVVKDTVQNGVGNVKKANVEKEPVDTFWVVAAVIAAVAAVAAVAVAVPKRTPRAENRDEKTQDR